jgi:hypothetical protein
VGSTTQTPLDQVETLLAQQRQAQEQLSKALTAARTEQQSGPISTGSAWPSLQWSSVAVITLAVCMCAAITAVVVAKVVRPKLRTLRDQRNIERANQEEMFVQLSLLGATEEGARAAQGNQKTDFRTERSNTAQAHLPASGYPATKQATYIAPEVTKVVEEAEIDFDLDLRLDDEPLAGVAPAELIAHADPEVAQQADVLLSALPQSGSVTAQVLR